MFFLFSGEKFDNPEVFLPKIICTLKGYLPSKFQLIRIKLFGGVREQTNKHTNSITSYYFVERASKKLQEWAFPLQ